MAPTILDSLKGYMTPAMVSKAVSLFGESESTINKAVGAAFPTILGGVLNKASDTGAMNQIFDLLNDRANDTSVLNNIGGLLSAGQTASPLTGKFLSALYGDKSGSLGGMLSTFSGVKTSTATSLINMAVPLVMAFLGDKIRKDGLNVSGLLSMLGGQRESIINAAPSALSGLLGVPSLANLGRSFEAKAVVPPAAKNKWIWPLILGLLGLLLLWLLMRGCEPPKAPVGVVDSAKVAVQQGGQAVEKAAADVEQAAKEAWASLGTFFAKTLPNGATLNIPEFGIENKLIGFIEDASLAVDKTTWFDFDRLLFETGSATLKPESEEQLSNIAAILKAYPRVKVKVGGYTDNTGDPAANMKLSQDRATSVMGKLIAMGVAADRLSAEGYGDKHPVADNSTEEGRAKNRRISLRVVEK